MGCPSANRRRFSRSRFAITSQKESNTPDLCGVRIMAMEHDMLGNHGSLVHCVMSRYRVAQNASPHRAQHFGGHPPAKTLPSRIPSCFVQAAKLLPLPPNAEQKADSQ